MHRPLAARGVGLSNEVIAHRLRRGMFVKVLDGVYAIAPVLDGARSRRMAATLTTPDSVLSHAAEDARKRITWERAGWEVARLPTDAVYEDPGRLLRSCPPSMPPFHELPTQSSSTTLPVAPRPSMRASASAARSSG
jgi:hypothetical protein